MKSKVINLLIKLKLKKIIPFFKGPVKIYNYIRYSMYLNLGKLTNTEEKIIIFASYNGKKFDDSPRDIYEAMLKDQSFKDYKFFWVFENTNKFDIPKGEIIKTNSFKFFRLAQMADYIVSNAALGDAFYYKGKNTIHINTWHGSAIKKIGLDRDSENKNWEFQGKHTVDYFCTQTLHDVKVISSAFNFPKEKILRTGLPRNDELVLNSTDNIRRIREHLNIPKDKKIILYAPTYRNYDRDYEMNYIEKSPVNFNFWADKLKNDYIVLFRAHYYITKMMLKDFNSSFVIDVSDYESINDLLIVSDILISDYSSMVFDYSILEKPIIFYAYDYIKYKEEVGLYLNLYLI